MLNFHINHYYAQGRKIGSFDIIQLGRLLGPGKFPYGEHIQHDYYELTLVTRGTATISANGVPTVCNEGDIYLSLPFEMHNIVYNEDTHTNIDFFAFRTHDHRLASLINSAAAKIKVSGKRSFQDAKINNLIVNAISELECETEFSETVLESIFNQVCIYLARDINDNSQNAFYLNTDNETITCSKIMTYIDINIFKISNLTEISKILNYSYGYMSALFKKTTGTSISNYYYNKKLIVAKSLIDENKLKPVQIAELLHYSTYYAFSKAFKNKFGISPRNYKNGDNK